MSCPGNNNSTCVVIIAGVPTPIKPTADELLAPGLVQVAKNSETSTGVVAVKAATQTTHTLK